MYNINEDFLNDWKYMAENDEDFSNNFYNNYKKFKDEMDKVVKEKKGV